MKEVVIKPPAVVLYNDANAGKAYIASDGDFVYKLFQCDDLFYWSPFESTFNQKDGFSSISASIKDVMEKGFRVFEFEDIDDFIGNIDDIFIT
jgi:hypothetical protein